MASVYHGGLVEDSGKSLDMVSGAKSPEADDSFSFIIIARQRTDARYWYTNFVRLSVRLSVRNTLVLYENG